MSLPSSFPSVFRRAGLCVVVALLCGCATTTRPVAVEVTSPPAPRTGSGPIAAYDAYAAAWFAPLTAKEAAVAAAARPAIESVPEAKVAAAVAALN